MNKNESPYCSICTACGEEGCCSALACVQHKDGDYCQSYLVDLKFGYRMYRAVVNKVHEDKEKYKELLEWWDKEYDSVYMEMYKLNNERDDKTSVATKLPNELEAGNKNTHPL